MSITIIKNDITKINSDAIVNAANASLLGGGGVDGAIHKAAGFRLFLECVTLGGCKVGQAKITNGYNLPCKYVIHTVGPKWKGGNKGEEAMLRSCYQESINLAIAHGCKTVSFPLISAGVYGYPIVDAIRVAVDAIAQAIQGSELDVFLVLYDQETKDIADSLYS